MRTSIEHLPSINNKLTPRQSPVIYIQLRNPFDSLPSKGTILPICHKTKGIPNKLPRIPVASPSPRFTKVISENQFKTKANFFNPLSRTPNRKVSDCYSPRQGNIFMIDREVTFGAEEPT